jgi:hypothetical protein
VSAYLRPTNQANRIGARVAGFDELVHVSSLNALVRRASRGDFAADVEATLRSLTGRRIPGRTLGENEPAGFDNQVADLAKGLLLRGKDGVRQAAAALAQAMGDDEPPWWAGFSEEIRDVLSAGDPADICAAMGLGHRTAGEWLVLWRYPVSAAGLLYRPTVIEANDSPYHFPSPPEYTWGVTMPLDPGFAACREVLHPPLRGAAAFEYCTGELLHLEETPLFGDNERLAALRAGHHERLRREFPTPSQMAWLDRCPVPR